MVTQSIGQNKKDTTWIKLGGAVRFNMLYAIYEGNTFDMPTENRNGVFWDTFRLEAEGHSLGLDFVFEYRFYPGFNTHFIKKGFLRYNFEGEKNISFGIVQVPFGMLEFLGNSWWFQLPYYVGLEDDYDTGVMYNWQTGSWNFKLAYFLMAEPRGVSEPDFGSYMSARYSYDVVPGGDGYNGNKERSQGNFRAEYTGDSWQFGVSTQVGEIFNSNVRESFLHWAGAVHTSIDLNPAMNIKGQITHYDYTNSIDDDGNPSNVVNMGAYGFGVYEVASNATIYSIGLSYSRALNWGPLKTITFYEDYSFMHKYGTLETANGNFDFVGSHHNVLGFSLNMGSLYVYFDIASGINQPWLSTNFGGTSLGAGRGETVSMPVDGENPPDDSPTINTRFNINIGYYYKK